MKGDYRVLDARRHVLKQTTAGESRCRWQSSRRVKCAKQQSDKYAHHSSMHIDTQIIVKLCLRS